MRVVEALRQVALPTEAVDGPPCAARATDETDAHATWVCTRHPGHDGPHVATYDIDLDEGPVTIIGLAWEEGE